MTCGTISLDLTDAKLTNRMIIFVSIAASKVKVDKVDTYVLRMRPSCKVFVKGT